MSFFKRERWTLVQKKLALWLQQQSNRVPVKVQQWLLLLFCIMVTLYCVLLILQPLIN